MPPSLECARSADSMTRNAGFASLANVLVGLIVVWTGFRTGTRIAWFVILVIVGLWAFPLMILPLLTVSIGLSPADWAAEAWHEPGAARIYLINIVMFCLMLIALILPVRSVFRLAKRE